MANRGEAYTTVGDALARLLLATVEALFVTAEVLHAARRRFRLIPGGYHREDVRR